jgi:hypothetical protein
VYQAKYGRLRRARWAARVGSAGAVGGAGAAGGGLEGGAPWAAQCCTWAEKKAGEKRLAARDGI